MQFEAVLFAFVSVPCLVAVVCAWKLHQWETARNERDDARKQNDFLLIKGLGAAIALGEATAKTVQRNMPGSNGEMSEALLYAREIKREQKEFLQRQGIESLH